MGSVKVVSWIGLAVLGLAGGCSSAPAKYDGASPSFRCVGMQDTKNSYVGMNFKFIVDQPVEYHHFAAGKTVTASSAE